MKGVAVLRISTRLALAASLLLAAGAGAQTASDTFQVSITIDDTCTINAADLSFGNRTGLAALVDASAAIIVNCSNTTTYVVRLDDGANGGRTMAGDTVGNTGTVDYELYTSTLRTTAWGTTAGVNTVGGTGNAANQTLTVYGRVPAQTTPNPDTYRDTVTATIEF